MEPKFAVYVIVVEDTEDNDLAIGALGASNIERRGDFESEQEAIDAADYAIRTIGS